MLKKYQVQGALASVSVKFGFALLSLSTAIILARILGPGDFGLYSYVLALVMFVSIPAYAGIPELIVRETAKNFANKDWHTLAELWLWAERFVLKFSILVLFIGLISCYLFFEKLGQEKAYAIMLGLFSIPFLSLTGLFSACLRGLGNTILGQTVESLFRPTILLLFIICVSFFYAKFNSLLAILVYVVATIVALWLSILLLIKHRPKQANSAKRLLNPQSSWYKSILPLSLISGLQVINGYSDIIVMGIYCSNEEVGIYKTVVQLSLLVAFGLQAINQVLRPKFSSLYELGEFEELQKLVKTSARVILFLSLFPIILCIFFGSNLLGLIFGAEFSYGGPALAVLAIGQLVNSAMGSVAALLNMTGHESYTIKGIGLAAVLNLLLNIILIPKYGMLGAAIATGFSMVVWNLVLRFYVRKLLNIEPSALF